MATLAESLRLQPRSGDPIEPAKIGAILAPGLVEIGLTALLIGWFAFSTGLGDRSADLTNTVGIVAFSLIVGWGGLRQLKQGAAAIWMPILWYRTAMVVYFGIGSLAPIYANADTRDLMSTFYDNFAWETIRLNLMIAIFHFVFIVIARFTILFIDQRPGDIAQPTTKNLSGIEQSTFTLGSLAVLCLVIGSAANYLIILPQTVGWYDFSFISTLGNLSGLAWIGYFMTVYWGMKNGRRGVVIITVLLALGECVIGLLNMSKAVILLPVVMIGIGFIYHRATIWRIGFFGIVLGSTLMILSPMIGSVRDQANGEYGGSFSPGDVFNMYGRYLTQGAVDERYSEVQSGWSRLSYVNVGTFAMSQYDQGMPGDSYRYLPIVLIPRIIYPDKPIITDVARELTYAANGNYYSSTAAGLPAEAYWNYGWIGVILLAIFLSFSLSLWSIYSFIVIRREAWQLFFVVLIGARTAMRIDGALVSDVVGSIGIAVLAHVALTLLNRFLPRRVTHFIRDDAPARN